MMNAYASAGAAYSIGLSIASELGYKEPYSKAMFERLKSYLFMPRSSGEHKKMAMSALGKGTTDLMSQ